MSSDVPPSPPTPLLSRVRGRPIWRWLPHVLVGLLAVPFIINQNSWYEWTNTLWLLELQTAHVAAHGLPTFFTDGAGMYFYPQQLFYAGPTLAVLSYPALVFGAWPVFAAATAVAFSAASAGISWTARNLGVPPGLAVVPGVLFAVTPYTVSNLYGRGDWAELVAVGALAVALGAATSLISGRSGSPVRAMAVLALAAAAVAGTHNLTLLLGALLAPVLAVTLLPLMPGSPRELLRRHALVLAGVIIGLAVCGAFLIPDLWLGRRTFIANQSGGLFLQVRGFDRPLMIFDPLPAQPPGNSSNYLHTQTLTLALVWCLAVAAVAAVRRWLDRRVVITLTLLCLGAFAISLLITSPGWWLHFPATLQSVQFPFRLVTYLALLTVVAVAVLLTRPAIRASRAVIAMLLLATAWQIGVAGDLALASKAAGAPTPAPPTPSDIRPGVTPVAFGGSQHVGYRIVPTHPIATPVAQAAVVPVGDDSPPQLQLTGSQPAGTLVGTAVVQSPLIRFTGDVTVAGSTADGFAVLRVTRSPWQATVGSVCSSCVRAVLGDAPLPLLAGRAVSLAGLLALAGLMVAAVYGRRTKN